MASKTRSIAAAITLFFVAPFVAEYLLGNIPIKLLGIMVVLAPMYGGGAILIREFTRRFHRGWPTMFVLGCAYTLIEEGFVDQSLTNPDYLALHGHFLTYAFIPAFGIGAWWLLFMFNLHVFFSTATSIALVEALVPSRRTTPWLGNIGLPIFAALFLIGCGAIGSYTYKKDHFLSSPAQFTSFGVAIVLLIVIAFRLPKELPSSANDPAIAPPAPWITASIALSLGALMSVIPKDWGWGAVAAMATIDAIFLAIVIRLSRRPAWTPMHTLSLGAAGALVYGLHAFIENPAVPGSSLASIRIGNAIFLAIALLLITVGARRTSRSLPAA